MKPAILYTRFSPRPEHKADKCESIEVQLDGCRRYCPLADLDPAHIISDKFTSACNTPFIERPGGIEAMEILSNGCRDIVVLKLDRIFRNAIDGLQTLDAFARQKIRLHIANQGGVSLDVTTATGRLVTTFLLGVTEYEPRITQERTSESMKRHQANGRRMGRKDRIPYGSQLGADESLIVPEPVEQAIIAKASELHQKLLPSSDIANTLNHQGHDYRGKPFTSAIIRRILKNRG